MSVIWEKGVVSDLNVDYSRTMKMELYGETSVAGCCQCIAVNSCL